eukprot:Lithocolla_globosa_v1_NODE_1527_length_2512_cov_118.657306.p1 type:complete len:781 gc:universal NODE_1527_length_2512_cov_118.657306:2400-58(-)
MSNSTDGFGISRSVSEPRSDGPAVAITTEQVKRSFSLASRTSVSSVLFSSKDSKESQLASQIQALEMQLEVELKIRNGAENLLKTVSKKKEKQNVQRQLEASSKKVQGLREQLASLNKKFVTRHGVSHSIPDLVDMIEQTNLTADEIREKIAFVNEKIQTEMKVKEGAEKLAKVYAPTEGKKLMTEVFGKIMDSNAKINLMKVAKQKYETGLRLLALNADERRSVDRASLDVPAIPHTDAPAATVGEDVGMTSKKYQRRVVLVGRLKVKVVSASNLCAAHKKVDARCLIKVDNQVVGKTATKAKVRDPTWGEEFEVNLQHASDIEFHVYHDKDLHTIGFFDPARVDSDSVAQHQMVLECEPRGEIHLSYTFIKSMTTLRRHHVINRRGAMRPKVPMSVIRFLGFAPSAVPDIQNKIASANKAKEMKAKQDEGAKPVATKPKREGGRCLDDFHLIRVLGKGNFGKVMLVEEKRTGLTYAIKVLKKDFIIENDEVESVKAEKRVFQVANKNRHPFLVKLHSCFDSEDRIYFVMEYVSGGDLMMHIQRQVFTQSQAKLYAAEVLLALEYLHENHVIYRDLKLDNILMDLDGHIKVADYGLCKEKMKFGSITNTFCGTPEFMAPEILLEQDYGRAVDWWALGVLIYEMLLAQSPFKGEEEEEIFDSILEGEVAYPSSKLDPAAKDILQKLLERDPAKRLGGGADDAVPIKAHPFFACFNWDALLRKEVPVTFTPKVTSKTDTNNFDPEFTRETPGLTPLNSHLSTQDQEEFEHFSYTAPWVDDP